VAICALIVAIAVVSRWYSIEIVTARTSIQVVRGAVEVARVSSSRAPLQRGVNALRLAEPGIDYVAGLPRHERLRAANAVAGRILDPDDRREAWRLGAYRFARRYSPSATRARHPRGKTR
jgi:hypothetical protein